MSVLGVDRYKTSSLRCTVHVDYDPGELIEGSDHRDHRLGPGYLPSTGKLGHSTSTCPSTAAAMPVAAVS